MATYKYWFPTGGYHPVDDSISPEDATTRLREVFPEGFISKATPMDEEAMHQRAVDDQGVVADLVTDPFMARWNAHGFNLTLGGFLAKEMAMATEEEKNDPRFLQSYQDELAALPQELQTHTFRQGYEHLDKGNYTKAAKEFASSAIENMSGMVAYVIPTAAATSLASATPIPGAGPAAFATVSSAQFSAENLTELFNNNPDLTLNDIADRFPHLLAATAGQVATEALTFRMMGLIGHKMVTGRAFRKLSRDSPLKRGLVDSVQAKILTATGPRSTLPRQVLQGSLGEGGAEVLQHMLTKWQAGVEMDYAEEDHMWELIENFWGGFSGGAGISTVTGLWNRNRPQTGKEEALLQSEILDSMAHGRSQANLRDTARLEAENRENEAKAAENSLLETELVLDQVNRDAGRSEVSEEDIHATALERNINSTNSEFIDFVRRTFPNHEGQIDSLSDLSSQERNTLYQKLKGFNRQGEEATSSQGSREEEAIIVEARAAVQALEVGDELIIRLDQLNPRKGMDHVAQDLVNNVRQNISNELADAAEALIVARLNREVTKYKQRSQGSGQVSFRGHSDSDIDKVTNNLAKKFKRHTKKAKRFSIADVKRILGDTNDGRAKSVIDELRANGVINFEDPGAILPRLSKERKDLELDLESDVTGKYTAQELSDLSQEYDNFVKGGRKADLSNELIQILKDNLGYTLNDSQVDQSRRSILDLARGQTVFPTLEEVQHGTNVKSESEYNRISNELKSEGLLQTNQDGQLYLTSRYNQGVVGREYKGVGREKFVVRDLSGSIISIHDTIEDARQSSQEVNEENDGGGYNLVDDNGKTHTINGVNARQKALEFIKENKHNKYKIFFDGVEVEGNLSKTKAEKMSRWLRSTKGLTGHEGRRRVTVARDGDSFQFRSASVDAYMDKLPDVVTYGDTKENLFVVEETKLGESGRYLGSKVIRFGNTLADVEHAASKFRDLRTNSFDSIDGNIVEEDADLADLRADPTAYAKRKVKEESPHLSEPITPAESKLKKAEMTKMGKLLQPYFDRTGLGHYGSGVQFVENMQDLSNELAGDIEGWASRQTGMVTLVERIKSAGIDNNSTEKEVFEALLPILAHEVVHLYDYFGLISPKEKARLIKRVGQIKVKDGSGRTLEQQVRNTYRGKSEELILSEIFAAAIETYVRERGWGLTDKQKASKKKSIVGADASLMKRIFTWTKGLGSAVNGEKREGVDRRAWNRKDDKFMEKFVPGEARDSLVARSLKYKGRPFDTMEGVIRPEKYTSGEKIVWDGNVNSKGDKWLTLITTKNIHDLADAKGVPWDNDEDFKTRTFEITGESNHLDELSPRGRRLVYLDLAGMQDPYNLTETQQSEIPKDGPSAPMGTDEEEVDNEPYTYEEEYEDESYADEDEYGMGSRPISNEPISEKGRASINKIAEVKPARMIAYLKSFPSKLIANGVAKDFEDKGSTDLIGKKIRHPSDLAILGQLYRNPQIEISRAFMVKNGKVVGQTGFTSRLPGSVWIAPREQMLIKEGMRNLRADELWHVHNHPSGDARPSTGDLNFTQMFIDTYPSEFMGSIVINHTEYGLIESNNLKRRLDRDGINTFESTDKSFPNFEFTKRDLNKGSLRNLTYKDTDKMTYSLPYEVHKLPRYDPGRLGDAPKNPSIPHPLLGTEITPDSLAELGSRMTHNTDGFVQLISFGNSGVKGIMDIPVDSILYLMGSHTDSRLNIDGKVKPYLQYLLNEFGRQTGATNFAVVNIPSMYDASKYKSTSEMDNRNASFIQLFFTQAVHDGILIDAFTVESDSLAAVLSTTSSGNLDTQNYNTNLRKHMERANNMGMDPNRSRTYPVHGEKGKASRGGNHDRSFSLPEGTSLEANPIFKKDGQRNIDTQDEGFHLPTYFRQTITPILKKLTHYDKDEMGGFIRNLHEVDDRKSEWKSTWPPMEQTPAGSARNVYQYVKNMMEMDLNVEVPHHVARELTKILILGENINQAAVKFAQYEEVEATLETGRTAEEFIEFLVRTVNRRYEDFMPVPDWQEEAPGMHVPDMYTLANSTMIGEAIEFHKEGRLWEPQYWDVSHWSKDNREWRGTNDGSALNNYHIQFSRGHLDGVLQEGPGAMKTWTDKEKGKASKRFYDEPTPSLENPLDPKDGRRAIDINKEGFHLPTYLERVIPPMIEHWYSRPQGVDREESEIFGPKGKAPMGDTEWGPGYAKGSNYFDEGADYDPSKLNRYEDPNAAMSTMYTLELKDKIRVYVNDVIASDLGINTVNFNDLEKILDLSIKTYEVNTIAHDIITDMDAYDSPSKEQIDRYNSSRGFNWFRDKVEQIAGFTDQERGAFIDELVSEKVKRTNANKDEGLQEASVALEWGPGPSRGITIYKEDIHKAMDLQLQGRMYSSNWALTPNGLHNFNLVRNLNGSVDIVSDFYGNTGQGNYEEKGKANIPRRERDRLERDRLEAIEQLPPAERERVRERDRIARANSEATIAKKKFNAAKRKSIDDERELLETDIKTTKSRGRDVIDTPIQIVTLKHIPTGVSIDIHEYAKVHDEFPVIVGLDVPARSEGLGIAGVLMEHARDIYPGIKTELYTGDASLYEGTRLASISDLSTDEIRKLIEVNEYRKERSPDTTTDYESEEYIQVLANRGVGVKATREEEIDRLERDRLKATIGEGNSKPDPQGIRLRSARRLRKLESEARSKRDAADDAAFNTDGPGEKGKASRGFDTTLPDEFRGKKLTFNKNTLNMMVKEAKSLAINKIKSRSYPDLKGTEKDRRIKGMVDRQQRYYNDIIRDDNIGTKVDVVSKLSNIYSSNQSATNHGLNSSDLYQFLKELQDAGVPSDRLFKIKNDMYESMGMDTRKIKINDLERNLLKDVSKIQFSQELIETKTPFSSIEQLMDAFDQMNLKTTPHTQNINGTTAYFMGNEAGFTEPIVIFLKPSGFRDMSIVEIASNTEYGSKNVEYAGEGSPPLHGAEATARTAMIMFDPSLSSKLNDSTEKGRASVGYDSTKFTPEERQVMDRVHATEPPSLLRQLLRGFSRSDPKDLRKKQRSSRALNAREAFVNKYDAPEKASDEVRRRALEKDPNSPVLLSETGFGDIILAQKANGILAAALKYGIPIFDKALGFTQAKLGSFKLHNVEGLPPIYKKEYGGFIDILGPALSEYGNRNGLMRKLHVVLISARAKRLKAQGKKVPEGIDDNYHALARKFLEEHPQLQVIANNYYRWNEGMIDYAVDTEYLSEAQGRALKSSMDYVSFKRKSMDMEDQLLDHDSLFNQELQEGLKGDLQDLKQPPRYEGSSEGKIEGFLEGATLNAFTMLQRGMNNQASKSVINDQRILWGDEIVRKAGTGLDANGVKNNKLKDLQLDTMIVMENGKEETYVIGDARVANAMKGSIGLRDPFVDGVLARFSAILRKGVTIAPAFIYRNTLKDPMVHALIGGELTGMDALTFPFKVVGNAISHLAGGSKYFTKEFLELESAGGASGIYNDALYAPTPEGFNNMLADQTRREKNWAIRPFYHIWDGLGVASTKSEAATRERVFESTFNRSGNLKEAMIQGMEVMNYDRRGGNQNFARYASMATFLSAGINGWDIADRALRKGTYSVDPNQNTNIARKKAWARVGYMSLLSLAYAVAWAQGDDEEWLSYGEEVRYNNWLVPTFGKGVIAVGLPFEFGVIGKILPELAFRVLLKGMSLEEAAVILGKSSVDALPTVAMPTALAGVVNIGGTPWSDSRGWNPFLESPIIPEHMPVGPMAYDDETSLIARGISTALPGGSSPKKWEHLISAYGGTMAINILAIADAVVDQAMPGDSPSDRGVMGIPTVKSVYKEAHGAGPIHQFHKWMTSIDDLTHEIRVLDIENPEKGRKLQADEYELLKYAKMARRANESLQTLNKQKRKIKASKSMTRDKMDEKLEQIEKQKLVIANRFNKMLEGTDYKHISYSGRTY